MIPVKGHPNLYRDENSGAIINCDTNAYNQYLNIKTSRQNQKDELDKIKQDIEEIKYLLKEIISSKA